MLTVMYPFKWIIIVSLNCNSRNYQLARSNTSFANSFAKTEWVIITDWRMLEPEQLARSWLAGYLDNEYFDIKIFGKDNFDFDFENLDNKIINKTSRTCTPNLVTLAPSLLTCDVYRKQLTDSSFDFHIDK